MQGKGFLLLFDSISDACWPEQSQQTKVPNSLFNPPSSPRMWKTKQTTFWEKKKRDQTSLAPASAGAARVPPAAPVSAALPSPARAAALQNKHTDRATNTQGLLFPFGRGGIAGRSLGKHGGIAVLSIRRACRFLNVVCFLSVTPALGGGVQMSPRTPSEPLGQHQTSLTELGVKGGRLAHDVRPPFLHRIHRLVWPFAFSPNQLEKKEGKKQIW